MGEGEGWDGLGMERVEYETNLGRIGCEPENNVFIY
jgi:hypothetical protein